MANVKFNEERFQQNYELLSSNKSLVRESSQPSSVKLLAECVEVVSRDQKVCVDLPLDLGSQCIELPVDIPDGTAAEACIDICRGGFGIPCGVEVYVKVGGLTVASASWGCC